VLTRVPIAQSQNVTLFRPFRCYATVCLGPYREPAVRQTRSVLIIRTRGLAPDNGAMIRQSSAHEALARALVDPSMTLETGYRALLAPPLYARWIGSPTVYTAVYRPSEAVPMISGPEKAGSKHGKIRVQADYTPRLW